MTAAFHLCRLSGMTAATGTGWDLWTVEADEDGNPDPDWFATTDIDEDDQDAALVWAARQIGHPAAVVVDPGVDPSEWETVDVDPVLTPVEVAARKASQALRDRDRLVREAVAVRSVRSVAAAAGLSRPGVQRIVERAGKPGRWG
jgi:hypothetical protein